MSMYDRQIKTAKRLIAKFGILSPVTTRTTVPNLEEPWNATESESAHTANVVFLPLSGVDSKTLSFMGNTEVPQGSVLAYMGAVDFKVDLKTTIDFDGKTWAVIGSDELKPNGRVILNTMVLKS